MVKSWKSIVLYAVVGAYAVLDLVPFVFAVLSSFKSSDSILRYPLGLPDQWLFSNFHDAWINASMSVYMRNTVIYTVVATGVLVFIGALAAYAISRLRESKLLYLYFTLGIMIPIHIILLPTFMLSRELNIVNKPISVILAFVAFQLAFGIFLMVGFLKTLPMELEEAALMDGCSPNKTFFRIILPLSMPVLATVGLLTFYENWNNILIPLVLITNPEYRTLTTGVIALRGMYTTNYGVLTAGIVISFMPVIVTYVMFQEKIIAGMTAGALKG